MACRQHFARHTHYGRLMVLEPSTRIVFADALQPLPLLTLSSASTGKLTLLHSIQPLPLSLLRCPLGQYMSGHPV